MAVCARCQVPLTLRGSVTAGPSLYSWRPCAPCQAAAMLRRAIPLGSRGALGSLLLWPSWQTWAKDPLGERGVDGTSFQQFVIYISDWFRTWRTWRHYSQSSKTEKTGTFCGDDRPYFRPVIFRSGSTLRVAAFKYKQLSSSVLLCTCLFPEVREHNAGQRGLWRRGEREDSNRSEQGSSLLLSCRLAYFNCSQAFTLTEDRFSACVYVGVGVGVGGCWVI